MDETHMSHIDRLKNLLMLNLEGELETNHELHYNSPGVVYYFRNTYDNDNNNSKQTNQDLESKLTLMQAEVLRQQILLQSAALGIYNEN